LQQNILQTVSDRVHKVLFNGSPTDHGNCYFLAVCLLPSSDLLKKADAWAAEWTGEDQKQTGKNRERVGARRLGAPKFVIASGVPCRSNSFVKPAMPKTTLSANRMKKIANDMFRCT